MYQEGDLIDDTQSADGDAKIRRRKTEKDSDADKGSSENSTPKAEDKPEEKKKAK